MVNGFKDCVACGERKPKSDFFRRSSSRDGLRSECKRCRKEKHSEYLAKDGNREKKKAGERQRYAENREDNKRRLAERYQRNKEQRRSKAKADRDANPEKHRAHARTSRARYAEDRRAARREDYQRNKARYKAQAVARMDHIKRATPLWADLDKIAGVYAEADRISLETGIPHHVDHFYPLRGKTMCGLHVEGNLRIIPKSDNLRKGNAAPVEIYPGMEI